MRTLVLIIISICFATALPAAAQSDSIYVASPTTDSVLVVNPESQTIVDTIAVGADPVAVAVNSETGRVFVANNGDNSISVIDTAKNEVIDTIELPGAPARLSVDADTNQVHVTLADSDAMVTIDGDSLEIVAPAPEPASTSLPPMPRFGRFVELLLPSYPLCPLNPDADRATFQTNLTPGLIDLQCRVLAENGQFVQPPAEIGVQSVLDLGVIHAVELFSPSDAKMDRIDVCLRGIGNVIFLDAAGRPRKPELLQRTVRSGYTCAQLPGPGTIILVR